MATPLPSQRHLFDIPDGVAYLNCAFLSPKPQAVLEAGRGALTFQAHPWEILPRHFYEPGDALRTQFARLIGGDAEGVALIPSVSYGVGVAARNLELGSGRSIVVVHDQFPSDLYPWRAKIAAEGGSIVTVEHPGTGAWTGPVVDAIDTSTAIVAVPHCHWTDGRAFDLAAIAEAARDAGAALVVDVSQSLGAVPFDVGEIQPDFLVTVGYKWQFGPYGYGYLWVAPRHRDGTPLESTWIGRKGSDDFARLVDYTDEYQPGARRFDVGEYSNFTLVPMARAALALVSELGPERIAATIALMTKRIEEGSRALGLEPIPESDRFAHMIGVRFPAGLPDGLRDRLAADSVYVSIRGSAVRVAPNVYNTLGDVERLLEAFRSVLAA
ncbi:MAG: aminotransferase class V-fold PLP-dependent enzyme [Acidimicrobiia bacterium]